MTEAEKFKSEYDKLKKTDGLYKHLNAAIGIYRNEQAKSFTDKLNKGQEITLEIIKTNSDYILSQIGEIQLKLSKKIKYSAFFTEGDTIQFKVPNKPSHGKLFLEY